MIRGGSELNVPIQVDRLESDGAAYADGRLRPGDEIIEINGHSTQDMSMREAVDRFKSGNTVSLLVRRAGAAAADANSNIPNNFVMQF